MCDLGRFLTGRSHGGRVVAAGVEGPADVVVDTGDPALELVPGGGRAAGAEEPSGILDTRRTSEGEKKDDRPLASAEFF